MDDRTRQTKFFLFIFCAYILKVEQNRKHGNKSGAFYSTGKDGVTENIRKHAISFCFCSGIKLTKVYLVGTVRSKIGGKK